MAAQNVINFCNFFINLELKGIRIFHYLNLHLFHIFMLLGLSAGHGKYEYNFDSIFDNLLRRFCGIPKIKAVVYITISVESI